MAGLLDFAARFGTEERCIEHLAGLRWPGGFVCSGCRGRVAWRLKARPRVYECATCHRQESVTAGTVFHRTRTDLTKWFLAAYLMGRDKRGVSAKFLQRELAVAYQTAWTMAHKLRHGLSEDPARPLRGFLEADETFIGGRGDPTSSGRSTAHPDKSLVVAAVEKVPAPKNKKGKHGHAVKRQHGFFAGNARIAVLPAATGAELGAFLKANVVAGSHLLTDGFAGYRGGDAGLDEHLKHTPVVQGEGANAASSSRSSIPCSATSKPGSSALITASVPSTCRAIFGNGATGSTAATCPTGWTAISFGAPSNAPPSPTISSRPAPCSAAPTVSGDFPRRLRSLR